MMKFLDPEGLLHFMKLILNKFQDKLVSGANISKLKSGSQEIDIMSSPSSVKLIRTIGGQSLFGTGDVNFKTINNTSITGTGNISVQPPTSFGDSFYELINTDNTKTISLRAASPTVLGGIRTGEIEGEINSSRLYPVIIQDNKACVYVPWVAGESGSPVTVDIVSSTNPGTVPQYGTGEGIRYPRLVKSGSTTSLTWAPIGITGGGQTLGWGGQQTIFSIDGTSISVGLPSNPTTKFWNDLTASSNWDIENSVLTIELQSGSVVKTIETTIEHQLLSDAEIQGIVQDAITELNSGTNEE